MFYTYYPLLIIIQVICVLHALRNNVDRKYIFLLILLPLIGAIIYLYTFFYSKEKMSKVSTSVKGIIQPNYELNSLEKEIRVSDTIRNKVALAQQYARKGRLEEAKVLFEEGLNGFNNEDTEVLKALLSINYSLGDYEKAIEYGERIKPDNIFNTSEEKIALAWSYYNIGKLQKAEDCFKEMNLRFSNYSQRIQYVYFLSENSRRVEAIELAEVMIEETDQMEGYEKKDKRKAIQTVRSIYNELLKA